MPSNDQMAKKTAVNLNAWAQLVSVGAAESSPCALFGSDRDRYDIILTDSSSLLLSLV